MSRDAGQILDLLPYTQITLRLSLQCTAVHMPADSMSTLRPTSCAAHTECMNRRAGPYDPKLSKESHCFLVSKWSTGSGPGH